MILVTGATGSIGNALVARLGGHKVRVLARRPEAAESMLPGVKAFRWEIGSPVPSEAAEGADAIIHLAGVPVDEKRLTSAQIKLVRDSRIDGTRAVVDACKVHKIATLVSTSAVSIYVASPDRKLGEDAPLEFDGALPEICQAWESEALRAETFGTRLVRIRVGIVLDAHGGALEKMIPIFRTGLAGRLGSGAQWMAWIHVQDAAGLFAFAVENEGVKGAVNAAAPTPVTNAEFTRVLARQLGRPAFLPVPGFALKLAMGEVGALALKSHRMVPVAALNAGYKFQFPDLQSALRNLVEA